MTAQSNRHDSALSMTPVRTPRALAVLGIAAALILPSLATFAAIFGAAWMGWL